MKSSAPIPPEHRGRFARLVADAWSDPAVAEEYGANPAAVLGRYDIVLAEGGAPPELPPAPDELAMEGLSSAGAAMATIGTVSCPNSCLDFGA